MSEVAAKINSWVHSIKKHVRARKLQNPKQPGRLRITSFVGGWKNQEKAPKNVVQEVGVGVLLSTIKRGLHEINLRGFILKGEPQKQKIHWRFD